MMKTVPNMISYHQEFSQIFSSPCSHFPCVEIHFRVFLKKRKALTGGACLSVAKLPRIVPGLAARGGTVIAPRHKGVPCPKPVLTGSTSEADHASAVRALPRCPAEPPPLRR
jgi:hypothetical protein